METEVNEKPKLDEPEDVGIQWFEKRCCSKCESHPDCDIDIRICMEAEIVRWIAVIANQMRANAINDFARGR